MISSLDRAEIPKSTPMANVHSNNAVFLFIATMPHVSRPLIVNNMANLKKKSLLTIKPKSYITMCARTYKRWQPCCLKG